MAGLEKDESSGKVEGGSGTVLSWSEIQPPVSQLPVTSASVTPPYPFLTWPPEYKTYPGSGEVLLHVSQNPGCIACCGAVIDSGGRLYLIESSIMWQYPLWPPLPVSSP